MNAEISAPRRGQGRRGLALTIMLGAQLMIILDATVVNIALPHIQNGLHFSSTNLSWVMNGYTLTFGGLLLLGGRRGRHPRPPPDVHRRPDHLHARLAGRRPRDHGRDAAGGPGHPGRRRRARLARRAGAGGQLVPRGQGAGQGARHLLGRGDRRQLARPGARRLYHRVALLALGAVHQRADRHRRRRDHPAVRQRDPPSARQVRPDRRDHLDRGHRRPRLRLHPGRFQRLGRHRGHRLVRGRGRAAGAVPVQRDPRRRSRSRRCGCSPTRAGPAPSWPGCCWWRG